MHHADTPRTDLVSTAGDPAFEDFRHENGIVYWWASEFMTMLGYPDLKSFKKVLDRATTAMISLSINHYEQIIPHKRKDDTGKESDDYKLTRFACYMLAMNGDPKKPEVAKAQAFFAEQTRAFQVMIEGAKDIERLIYRDEFTKGHSALMSAAKDAGVHEARDFAEFQNAGYLGMYNQTAAQLTKNRKVPEKGKLLDHMGRTELAANLFRVTQTEEKLKQDKVNTPSKARATHFNVSRQIRSMMIQNTGKTPESLALERPIQIVKTELKKGKKAFDKIDQKPKPKGKK